MFKKLLTGLVLLVLTATFPALGQRGPPPAHQAAEIEALVNKASVVVEEWGSKAFADFRTKGSSWRYADVYLFVVDMNGVVLFNAARPDREERDFLDNRMLTGNGSTGTSSRSSGILGLVGSITCSPSPDSPTPP